MRFRFQMTLLAVFYTVCTFVDWIMFLSGKATIHNKEILCYKENYVLVNSNLGGLYMLVFTIITYTYAMFMWYVFYQVPKKFGVVTRRSVDDVADMIGTGDTSIMMDEENLKTVVRELEHDRRFTKHQMSKVNGRNDSSEGSNHFQSGHLTNGVQ